MEYYPVPQPDELADREKEDATGAYLMMFATTAIGLPMPVINLIASIVYYFVNRDKGLFVKFHTLQSLFSQIPVSLLNSAAVIWAILNFVKGNPFTQTFWGYVIAAGVMNVLYFTFSILAAVRAHKGRMYYFLFFGRLAYVLAFRKTTDERGQYVNKPPVI